MVKRDSEHVGQDHASPLLDVIGQEAATPRHPRVGQHGVHAAEVIEGRRHETLLVVPHGHVTGYRQRSLGTSELLRQATQLGFAPRRKHHSIAGSGGGPGGGGTDATRRAGDEQDGLEAHGSIRSTSLRRGEAPCRRQASATCSSGSTSWST